MLAAKRAGITEVILPRQNAVHMEEDLKKEQREGPLLHYVKTFDEVIHLALEQPEPQRPAVDSPEVQPAMVH